MKERANFAGKKLGKAGVPFGGLNINPTKNLMISTDNGGGLETRIQRSPLSASLLHIPTRWLFNYPETLSKTGAYRAAMGAG